MRHRHSERGSNTSRHDLIADGCECMLHHSGRFGGWLREQALSLTAADIEPTQFRAGAWSHCLEVLGRAVAPFALQREPHM